VVRQPQGASVHEPVFRAQHGPLARAGGCRRVVLSCFNAAVTAVQGLEHFTTPQTFVAFAENRAASGYDSAISYVKSRVREFVLQWDILVTQFALKTVFNHKGTKGTKKKMHDDDFHRASLIFSLFLRVLCAFVVTIKH
jgi:hypothetical protein